MSDKLTANLGDFSLSDLPDPDPGDVAAPPPGPWVDPWPSTYSFLTGPAGSGKTFLTRERLAADPHGHTLLCATTGIAAINLGDATTINATLKYFNTAHLVEGVKIGRIQQRLRRLRAAGIRRIVIDEVSMLEAEALDALVDAFEQLNTEVAVEAGQEPEVGLTLVGDFLQLPPVEGQYAFQAPSWYKFAPHVERLTTIRRQADATFIEGLRALRIGDGATAQRIFAPCFVDKRDSAFQGSTIFSRNADVDAYNRLRHDQLPGTAIRFPRRTWGELKKEWEQIPQAVGLRPGALVMVLANRTDADGQLVYANGDLGEFLGTEPNLPHVATVRLHRTGAAARIAYTIRSNEQPGVGSKPDVVGEIQYMPLRLAYATTVHKSQGLTLDEVQISIQDPFFGKPAMAYVALSRARTLSGLRIIGDPRQLALRTTMDPRVTPWK